VPELFLLTRDLTRPIAEPVWPDEVSLVPFSATLAPKAHALMQAAYANGGGSVPPDFDSWWAATRHDPEFDAGLCFVAAANGEPIGFSLCWTPGFVKDLVVHPDWQGRGIGTALLRTALQAFASRGLRQAALKVQTDNIRARRLYAEAGFHKD
jgi:ribosomal protein S18 acetylase RimI-like enzyme